MSSNDQTTGDGKTRPTLETVLERINAVAGGIAELRKDVERRFDAVEHRITDEVAQLRKEVEQRFEAVAGDIAHLRKDVEQGFRKVERKIGYLNNDFLERRGEQEDMLLRIEALENKAS
jgi:BMFP domain-containing protein YqiC